MEETLGPQAFHTFNEIEQSGKPVRPLDFPPPNVHAGVRVNALVVHPETGARQVLSGVIHRADLSDTDQVTAESTTTTTGSGLNQPAPPRGFRSSRNSSKGKSISSSSTAATSSATSTSKSDGSGRTEILAYWPQRRLQDAIYGSVWACLILRRHHGIAADDAARAAGVEPGSASAPIVWELTSEHVAIKMVEWARVHHMRGRLLEDPVKEVSAMQLLGARHPNVLGSSEVLQDGDFLYSVMPFCRDGDLFTVVVQYAEQSHEDAGMPEPVARYWFRQILWGLHHLQREGVCHRDLSLENILVDGDRCMIIDMGMCLRVPYNDPTSAGAVTDVTRGRMRRLMKPQGVCGKHNYMSPEVAANADAFDGFAIDLWAAGVILYIMLTGFPPYDQANRTDQRFELIVTGRLMEQLRNWDIFLSDDAGNLLQSMLQLDPRRRLTLSQIMNHPWVASDDVEAPQPSEPLFLH